MLNLNELRDKLDNMLNQETADSLNQWLNNKRTNIHVCLRDMDEEVMARIELVSVLNDISFTIHQGEKISIVGLNGAGKTTLVKLICRLYKPTSGTIYWNGIDINMYQYNSYLSQIAAVFQDFKLLSDRSVKENLLFVLKATGWKDKSEMDAQIQEVLEKVGMANFASKMPHQLSGGEQQRVAIARALLNDPELILADEPSGNLDPQTSIEIMEVLRNINANGKTVIIATHDYALLLKYPSKTLKFEDGKVYEVVQKAV